MFRLAFVGVANEHCSQDAKNKQCHKIVHRMKTVSQMFGQFIIGGWFIYL